MPPPLVHTLSLHDALPICAADEDRRHCDGNPEGVSGPINIHGCPGTKSRCPATPHPLQSRPCLHEGSAIDRKSTRLNSSHSQISYAVFCLKKKTSLNAYAV